jgi:hypothetical protein
VVLACDLEGPLLPGDQILAEGWVRFDEYEDVLASTDLLAMVAPNLRRHPSNWKW